MRRRALLASGVAGLSTAVAGCLGGGDDADGDGSGEDGADGSVGDDGDGTGAEGAPSGLAPEPRDVPAPDVDVAALQRLEVGDQAVPLLPIDDAHPWYARREARFVDARAEAQYAYAHVAGAVHSPAPAGHPDDDPVAGWSTDERIVTYCTCPHGLSTQRAATLLAAGYESVFALDEGFEAWVQQGYPIQGEAAERALPEARSVAGRVDPAYAGRRAWVRHEASAQREPGPIRADGRFEIEFRFVGLAETDPLTVETPAWTETAPLRDLTGRELP